MNRNCPHCGVPIGWKQSLRSKRVPRSILRLPIRVTKCASCGGMATNNPHPTERWVSGMAEFWAMVVAIAWIAAGSPAALVAGALVLGIVVVLVLRARAQTKDWSRFKPYDPDAT